MTTFGLPCAQDLLGEGELKWMPRRLSDRLLRAVAAFSA
jgi:hypothetical protein